MATYMRNSVKKSLSQIYSQNEAKSIEPEIFKMCQKIYEASQDKSIKVTAVPKELNDVYSKYAYEKVGAFYSYPDLKNAIIKDIKEGKIGWNECIYAKFRENEKKDTSDQVSGMKVSKGEFKCKNNRCTIRDECYYYTMQTSSCDESMTTYVVCSHCGDRYTIK